MDHLESHNFGLKRFFLKCSVSEKRDVRESQTHPRKAKNHSNSSDFIKLFFK